MTCKDEGTAGTGVAPVAGHSGAPGGVLDDRSSGPVGGTPDGTSEGALDGVPGGAPGGTLGSLGSRLADGLATGTARWAAYWLPPRCTICGAPGSAGIDLCAACLALLPPLSVPIDGRVPCRRCGDPVPTALPLPRACCGRCRGRPAPFVDIVAPWRYERPVDRLIGALKHGGLRPLARVFGESIARQAAAGQRPLERAIVLPVPLHAERERRRGFNQAAEIARWAARPFGLSVREHAAIRVSDTGSLASRSRAERELAIRGVFAVDPALADRHVILVDDVLTSGATSGELARECRDSGVASLSLWVVARTASQ